MKQLNINKINFNETVKINLSITDYRELTNNISYLQKKYKKNLDYLFNIDKNELKNYSFKEMLNHITKCKNIVISIINDVITLYQTKLEKLECVFISGSYARGTNKLASDLDLHFFYSAPLDDYLYEEIICFIVAKILRKRRDSIDPTFILNFHDNKDKITKLMDNNILEIQLITKNEILNYTYSSAKKRRFYLQYLNSRNLSDLKEYLIEKIKMEDEEYTHCFDVIYGKKAFAKMYKQVFAEECKLITTNYIIQKIDSLINELQEQYELKSNKICDVKHYYQSHHFNIIFKYFSILRCILINDGKQIQYFNLLEIMSQYQQEDVFYEIYKYFWLVEKLSNYCIIQNIPYGLHNDNVLKYNFTELDIQWLLVVDKIKKDLIERRKKYGKNNINFTYDAS